MFTAHWLESMKKYLTLTSFLDKISVHDCAGALSYTVGILMFKFQFNFPALNHFLRLQSSCETIPPKLPLKITISYFLIQEQANCLCP